jgi:hypothetical protein
VALRLEASLILNLQASQCRRQLARTADTILSGHNGSSFKNDDPRMGKSVDGIGEYIAEIQKLPLDARIKNDMLGGTAARLLKLEA